MLENLPVLLATITSLFSSIKAKLDTKLDKTAAASSAVRLDSSFTLSLSGDVVAAASVRGDSDVNLTAVLKDIMVQASAGSAIKIPTLTIDNKGRVISIAEVDIRSGTLLQPGVVQLSSATNSTATDVAATPAAVKLAFDLATAAIPNSKNVANGVFTSLDMIAGPGLVLAQALPGALYGKGYIQGRASGLVVGVGGPSSIGGRTGLLKIFAAIDAGATGSTPFNAIRREFSGFNGVVFAQYAIDANTWSTWQSVAFLSSNVLSASSLNLASVTPMIGTPVDFLAGYPSNMAKGFFPVRDAPDAAINNELVVPNIAALDPQWNVSGNDIGLLTMWPEAAGTNQTAVTIRRELEIHGLVLISSADSTATTWGAWTIKSSAKANTLTTPRTIALTGDGTWAVNFNGSADVTASFTLAATGVVAGVYPKVTVDAKGRVTAGAALSAADIPTLNQSTTGNAATATKWATPRTLSYTGDATGTASLDGSADVAFSLTLAASGVVAGSYPKVTVDAKGRVTAGAALVAADIPALDTGKLTTGVLPLARGGTAGFNMAARNITISTADPSGGSDGDIWLKYV